jgi:hypothetical protein
VSFAGCGLLLAAPCGSSRFSVPTVALPPLATVGGSFFRADARSYVNVHLLYHLLCSWSPQFFSKPKKQLKSRSYFFLLHLEQLDAVCQ